MSWEEYSFKKGKTSFIAKDFNTNEVLSILDERTQTVTQNHFLRYHRKVCELIHVITMDMYSPYYLLVKLPFQMNHFIIALQVFLGVVVNDFHHSLGKWKE